MKVKRPIAQKLREAEAILADGGTLFEVCQALGIGERKYHRWRRQFDDMKAEQIQRLEDENQQLKKLLAEAELEKAQLRKER